MNKLLILASVVMLFCAIGFVVESVQEEEDNQTEEHQGPVPLGYDLEHFRNTGETIKIGVDD